LEWREYKFCRHDKVKPSFVGAEDSGREATALERGLLGLCTESGLIGGGLTAGSICQGETLSGRGMEEASSHLTWITRKHITTMFQNKSLIRGNTLR
jgi:hypothetical protein